MEKKNAELRSCVKVEVVVLGTVSNTVSVDLQQHCTSTNDV